MNPDSDAKIFSAIGRCGRSGRWLVPERTSMLTLFGSAVVDLRDARATAEAIEFTCTSVFATVTFIVPEGAEIRPSGIAVFGSARSTVPLTDEACHLPSMAIDAVTIFGRLRIRTTEEAPEETRRGRWRERRRAKSIAAAPSAEIEPPEVRERTPPATPVDPVPSPVSETPAPVVEDAAPPAGVDPLDSREVDLSAPIAAFSEPDDTDLDDTSPLHDVEVPSSMDNTILDESEPSTSSVDEVAETSADSPEDAEAADEGDPVLDGESVVHRVHMLDDAAVS